MISLVLAGKVPINEDSLMAALVDALRYSQSGAVVQQVLLESARPYVAGTPFPEFDRCEIFPWPSLRGREPDARMVLTRAGAPACRLLVEAKLGAIKSGDGAIDDAARSGDQLAYYLRAEALENPGERVGLLYLTHHSAMPQEDLAGSADQLTRAGRADLVSALLWTSWRDVEESLRRFESRPPWLEDLLKLLWRAKMRRLIGFDVFKPAPVATGSARFYDAKPAAGYPAPLTAPSLRILTGRWSYERRYFVAHELGSLAASSYYRSHR